MLWKTVLAISLLLLEFSLLDAQEYLFDIQELNVKDGMPNRRVFDIVQDKKGYIWIGLHGEISHYDGDHFSTFNTGLIKSQKINIPFLAVDGNDNLWYYSAFRMNEQGAAGVITADRNAVLDFATFTNGLFASKDVFDIQPSLINDSVIFVTLLNKSVYKFNGVFEEIFSLDEFKYNVGPKIFETPEGDGYYMLHNDTFFKVKNKKKVATYPINLQTVNGNSNLMPLTDIIPWGTKFIIKGKIKPGLETDYLYLKLKNGQLEVFHPTPDTGIINWDTWAIEEDVLLLNADKKLITYNSFTGDTLLSVEPFERSIFFRKPPFIDKQNRRWVPSENGLYKITSKKNPFEPIEAGCSMRGIYQQEDQLFLGSYKRNIYINNNTKEVKTVTQDTVVMSYFEDREGHIWAGHAMSVLKEYIPATDKWNSYFIEDRKALSLPFQNKVSGQYWVGSASGLMLFNKASKSFTPFELTDNSKNVDIQDFFQNEEGVWIATDRGLFLMDAETDTLRKHYTEADGLPHSFISYIYEDKDGIFWLASKGGGLIRWDIQQNSFKQFTQKDGLTNNTIYAVYEDDYGKLWLPSNYGLMCFDKNTGHTRVFLPEQGIPHEEFNTFSHFQAADGTLYFGGLNGAFRFHPKDLRDAEELMAPLVLTKLQILEQGAENFKDKTADFKKTGSVSMNSGDKILEIEVSLLDYEKSSFKQYAYQIEGRQDGWIYTNDNKISLINLPYGNYNIIIKGRGVSGVWSEGNLSIPLHINPPFYLRLYFLLPAFALMFATILFFIKWRLAKLEKDKVLLEAEIEKRTRTIAAQAEELKELDKSKTRFFSNITHEFRTPLTLIIGPLDQLLSENQTHAIRQKLSGIAKNARHLLTLINQLLDLSKLESGKMITENARGDIINYTKELVYRFQPLIKEKQLELNFIADQRSWETHFDATKWDKIIYNLLSNAIKFTPERGKITVQLDKKQQEGADRMQLEITDTGIGMTQEAVMHIFKRFHQVDSSTTRVQEGTGIGLALVKELVELQNGEITVQSELGKGSSFKITVPVLQVKPNSYISEPQVTSELLLPVPELRTQATIVSNGEAEVVEFVGEGSEKLELLIIEDNKEMQAYIRSCLDETLYRIVTADDGAAGIQKAKAIIPDLIISDVMMPKKDGFEVTQAIRDDLATSHIPLILLTAKAALESRLEGLDRGADAYLTKPFSPEELILRIRKLIEFRKHLQQRYESQEFPKEELAYEKEDIFIIELRKYIVANIQSELSVEQVSKHFAMSRAQLYRKLKALTGKSLTDLVRTTRLSIALKLIKAKELNLSEIADETGFSSLSHFSRTFKKSFGKPPSEI